MTLPFHPIANLFPLIEGEAFRQLVDDVLEEAGDTCHGFERRAI